MLLVIDNYDSFTYNLVQYFGELGAEPLVRRNDEITLAGIAELKPERICISPGPCTPTQAGISLEVVAACADAARPLLGVCLGHQAIGQHFGGNVVRGGLMHGKTSPVDNDGSGVFAGLPSPFVATRYHSLTIAPDSLPNALRVTARSGDGTIMGVIHNELPIEGVQFHPESIASEHGHAMIRTFLDRCRKPEFA